ncbi:hypothetical protein C8Q77DRAFT_1159528 [Trametes polyzona]|nr:hypothetical protein C8Q77DRAFT_1159528 [Trametes polyzona]
MHPGPSPAGTKRAATLTQYAEREVMAKRLKGEHKDAPIRTNVKPHKAAWDPPQRVVTNMKKYGICLLLSPSLAEYDSNGVVKTLMSIVEKKQWGLPANLRRQHEEKWVILIAQARDILTQRKSEIKKAILTSMNLSDTKVSKKAAIGPLDSDSKQLHIYAFCSHLSTALGKKSGLHTDIAVTIEMCTRFAFLRFCARSYLEQPCAMEVKSGKEKDFSGHYWEFVDNTLELFRSKSKDSEGRHQVVVMHQYFINILIEDQKMYPSVSETHNDVLSSLATAKAGDAQAEFDRFVLTGEDGDLDGVQDDE